MAIITSGRLSKLLGNAEPRESPLSATLKEKNHVQLTTTQQGQAERKGGIDGSRKYQLTPNMVEGYRSARSKTNKNSAKERD